MQSSAPIPAVSSRGASVSPSATGSSWRSVLDHLETPGASDGQKASASRKLREDPQERDHPKPLTPSDAANPLLPIPQPKGTSTLNLTVPEGGTSNVSPSGETCGSASLVVTAGSPKPRAASFDISEVALKTGPHDDGNLAPDQVGSDGKSQRHRTAADSSGAGTPDQPSAAIQCEVVPVLRGAVHAELAALPGGHALENVGAGQAVPVAADGQSTIKTAAHTRAARTKAIGEQQNVEAQGAGLDSAGFPVQDQNGHAPEGDSASLVRTNGVAKAASTAGWLVPNSMPMSSDPAPLSSAAQNLEQAVPARPGDIPPVLLDGASTTAAVGKFAKTSPNGAPSLPANSVASHVQGLRAQPGDAGLGGRTDGTANVPQPATSPSSFNKAHTQVSERGEPSATEASGINLAGLIRSATRSDMQVHVNAEEFGRISIHTAYGRDAISAQITLQNAQLGSAVAAHLSAVEQKLAHQHGLRVSITLGSQSAGSGGTGRDGQPESRRHARPSIPTGNGIFPSGLSSESPVASHPLSPGVSRTGRLDIRI